MAKILLIEDNSVMALALVKYLVKNGFEVDHFESVEKAQNEIEAYDYDCYLFDLNLPKASGYDGAKFIRGFDKNSPIIAITAKDSIEDKLKGFEVGFTDYIVKPFDLRELIARINTHLKQLGDKSTEKINLGKLAIDKEKYEVLSGGKKLQLTKIEFNILFHLAQNANLLVTNDDLIEAAWGDEANIINPPIRMHISNLRKKLNDDDYTLIETVPGVGYKFNS